MNSPWPFDQSPDTAAITMRQILDGSEPILLVTHDADDHGWQFIGSSDANTEDGRVVALEEIAAMDPTVLEVADIPPGWWAWRDDKGLPWTREERSPQAWDDED